MVGELCLTCGRGLWSGIGRGIVSDLWSGNCFYIGFTRLSAKNMVFTLVLQGCPKVIRKKIGKIIAFFYGFGRFFGFILARLSQSCLMKTLVFFSGLDVFCKFIVRKLTAKKLRKPWFL